MFGREKRRLAEEAKELERHEALMAKIPKTDTDELITLMSLLAMIVLVHEANDKYSEIELKAVDEELRNRYPGYRNK